MKNLFGIIVLIYILSSCEKSIDYQLKSQSKEPVLIAFLMPDSVLKIHASYSTDILSPELYSGIEKSELIIQLNDVDNKYIYPDGNQWLVVEDINLKPGDLIKTVLKLGNNGQELFGTTSIPPAIQIQYLDTATVKDINEEQDEVFVLKCFIKIDDPGKVDNFYQLQLELLVNEVDEGITVEKKEYIDFVKEDKVFFARDYDSVFLTDIDYKGSFDDYFFDGRSYWLRVLVPKEKLEKVESTISKKLVFKLFSLSGEYYKYLRTTIEQKAYRKDPLFNQKNVYSNIENGLGIVAGLNLDTDTIVIFE